METVCPMSCDGVTARTYAEESAGNWHRAFGTALARARWTQSWGVARMGALPRIAHRTSLRPRNMSMMGTKTTVEVAFPCGSSAGKMKDSGMVASASLFRKMRPVSSER
jgi:hypothetical protein